MAGKLLFNIDVEHFNTERIPEIAARARDMRPVFANIIDEWAKNTADKFARGAGMGMTGADIDPGVYWQALSTEYWRRKLMMGKSDDLMVFSGETREALSDKDKFWHESTAQQVAFGTPTDPDVEKRVRFNWTKRQVIFLSNDDQRMIESEVSSYFQLGDKYRDILFAKGLQRKKDHAQLEVDFGSEN